MALPTTKPTCPKCGRTVPASAKRELPIPRFAIRDLLLLTVIVGLAAGWWAEHCSLTAARDTALTDAGKFASFYLGRGSHMPEKVGERKWLDELVRKYCPKEAAARWDYIPDE